MQDRELPKKRVALIGSDKVDAALLAQAITSIEESGMEIISMEDVGEYDSIIDPKMFAERKEPETYMLTNPYHDIIDLELNDVPKWARGKETVPVRNSNKDPKIGRNDPCPCGSGKKYKNCCLLKN